VLGSNTSPVRAAVPLARPMIWWSMIRMALS
jgi:hypothetical protein